MAVLSYRDNANVINNRKISVTFHSLFENDVLKDYWKEMNEKYTKDDLEAATSNIYQILSGPNPPSVEEVLYMRPPEKLQRSSASAFHDLLKMFR